MANILSYTHCLSYVVNSLDAFTWNKIEGLTSVEYCPRANPPILHQNPAVLQFFLISSSLVASSRLNSYSHNHLKLLRMQSCWALSHSNRSKCIKIRRCLFKNSYSHLKIQHSKFWLKDSTTRVRNERLYHQH